MRFAIHPKPTLDGEALSFWQFHICDAAKYSHAPALHNDELTDFSPAESLTVMPFAC